MHLLHLAGRSPLTVTSHTPPQAAAATTSKCYAFAMANSTGLVTVSALKGKCAVATFTNVTAYSKYASVALVSSTSFKVTPSSNKTKTMVLVSFTGTSTTGANITGKISVKMYPAGELTRHWSPQRTAEPVGWAPVVVPPSALAVPARMPESLRSRAAALGAQAR